MSKAIVVESKIPMSLKDVVRYQVNLYCFINKKRLSPAQQDCLSLLGLYGDMNISDFCEQIVDEEIFGNVQTTRNFVVRCVKDGLIVKKGLGNKIICLNNELNIITSGTIVLKHTIFHHVQESSK